MAHTTPPPAHSPAFSSPADQPETTPPEITPPASAALTIARMLGRVCR